MEAAERVWKCASVKTLIAALVVIGCGHPVDHDVEAAPAAKPAKPPVGAKDSSMSNELTWKLTKQAGKLHVTYHFENHTNGVVYVNDGIVAQIGNNTFKKFATNSAVTVVDAQTVLITVGTPTGDVPAAAPTPGFYVAVAKGASFDGARDVAFPFQGSDPLGRAKPLGDKFTRASFALYVSDGEPAKWRELPTDNGNVKIPDGPNVRIITLPAQPLP
jgi:hypothetical protein